MKVLVEENGHYVLREVNMSTSVVSSVINPVILKPQTGAQALISTLVYTSVGLVLGTVLGKRIPGISQLAQMTSKVEEYEDYS